MSNKPTIDEILDSIPSTSWPAVEKAKRQLSKLIEDKERIAYNKGIMWTAEDNVKRRKLMEPAEVAQLIADITRFDQSDILYMHYETVLKDTSMLIEANKLINRRAKERGIDLSTQQERNYAKS